MKKLSLILCFFLTIFLVSCEPDKYYFKNNTRNDEIIGVDLISYNADDIEIVESKDEMLDFNGDSMTIFESLNQSEVENFISEFTHLEFFLGYPHLSTPNGTGVKINYDNGDFLIITDSVLNNDGYIDAILYNSEYQFVEYFGSISWRQNFIDLINEYFQTQLE